MALAVVNGKTEREVQLETEIASEREARKKEQTRLSELEDENRKLKTPPAPKKKKDSLESWLAGED